MRIKNGVIVYDNHQWAHVEDAVDRAYFEVVGHQAMLTSAAEGVHMETSKHYIRQAWDFRIYQDNDTKKPKYPFHILQEIATKIREKLGSMYDVTIGKINIHTEYDPK